MNSTTDILGQVLQGEYMGVDSFQKGLNRLKDDEVRHDLEQCESEMREMVTELSSHMRDMGVPAPEDSGLMGFLAGIPETVKILSAPDDSTVLDEIYAGMEMGVGQTEKVLLGLQGDSRSLVEKHLDRNRSILRQVDRIRREKRHLD